MTLVEKTTFSGNDMRTYRCDHCREEHVVDYGPRCGKCCPTRANPANDA
jgi:hypothetical protein